MSINNIIGYYKSWDAHNFPPSKIDVKTYTYINYAFLGLNENGSLRLDNSEGDILKLAKLKRQNSHIKLLFSIGGQVEGSQIFSSIAADNAKTKIMSDSCVAFLKKYEFDGFDIDWEFPHVSDKENFVELLRSLKQKLESTGHYLLSVAVSPLTNDPNIGYNIPAISKIVDYINVMTYNFHLPSEGKTGQNSPLYFSNSDSEWQREHCNCDVSIQNWIKAGAPKEKLILGLAFYGHVFNLITKDHNVGAPTTRIGSIKTFKEISQLDEKTWTTIWDEQQQVPYKYSQNQWIGYDNQRSITIKLDYCKRMNLGGVMVWALNDTDNANLLSTC